MNYPRPKKDDTPSIFFKNTLNHPPKKKKKTHEKWKKIGR